jgi:predicted TIM-barrel fold metal-dependent hydrolase
MKRRELIQGTFSAAMLSGAAVPKVNAAPAENRPYRRIACEEGFLVPEVVAANGKLGDIGIPLITADGPAAFLAQLLCDIGEGRLAAMDRDGVDMQLLMISAPGLQVFDPDTAVGLAREVNEQASAACRAHPDRFAALAAIRHRPRRRRRRNWNTRSPNWD